MASQYIKASLVGLVAAAGFGLLSSPARADNETVIEQGASQQTGIVGDGNTSATSNSQVADILQKARGGRGYGQPGNGASVRQGIDQSTGISGHGNTSGTVNEQNATVTQEKVQPTHRPVRRGYYGQPWNR